MKTIEVEESLLSDEMTGMIAGGVYAADRLPRTIPYRPLLYIANTDPHFRPGRHWVVIHFGEEHIEYFDPLGKEPNNIIEDYLTLMGPNGYLRNVRRVQDNFACIMLILKVEIYLWTRFLVHLQWIMLSMIIL